MDSCDGKVPFHLMHTNIIINQIWEWAKGNIKGWGNKKSMLSVVSIQKFYFKIDRYITEFNVENFVTY